MTRLKQTYASEGFFGIGICNSMHELNIGTLWRSAFILGASFIFTVGKKYQPQSSDVTKSWTKIPLYHYPSLSDLKAHIPHATQLIGVEMTENAVPLAQFEHPDRAIYLLGNEQHGLSQETLDQCQSVIKLPGHFSLNVASTGSILIYDRITKVNTTFPK